VDEIEDKANIPELNAADAVAGKMEFPIAPKFAVAPLSRPCNAMMFKKKGRSPEPMSVRNPAVGLFIPDA
jgi:hypothetical protein